MAVKMTFEQLVDTIQEAGYIKQWKAINEDYRDEKLAKKIVKAINSDEDTAVVDAAVMKLFTDLWHKIGIELSWMTKKEYFENPDAPLWEDSREDWVWNSETEEWDYAE